MKDTETAHMRHLPLFAELRGRPCIVVGGGVVAERRVRLLRSAGAPVTVRAARISEPLRRLAGEDASITLEEAPFDADAGLGDYWLVVAATDDRAVNAAVSAAAERACRFCNVVDDAALSSFIMPAIVDRDPVTIAISSAGLSPVVARHVKGLIESLVPFRLGALARLAGDWRQRAKQAIPDVDRRRHFWQSVVEGPVADQVYAGRDEAAEQLLSRALAQWSANEGSDSAARAMGVRHGAPLHGVRGHGPDTTGAADPAAAHQGEAWLVGAGPGNPELITLAGRQLLAAADVVLYDRLGAPGVLEFARRDAEHIPVGKRPGAHSVSQSEINRLLVRLVSEGKKVCRLKGGDPMIFGRAGEELDALLEAGLPFRIVPGVSAVQGCAAYAGIPLTLRNVSRALLITTGHDDNDDTSDLASFRPGQTLALYMGVAHYATIAQDLIRLGHDADTPVAVVERGTTDSQRVVVTVLRLLGTAARELSITPPALLVIGETARCAERFAWFGPSRVERFDDRAVGAYARVT